MDEEEKAIERCKELTKPEYCNWIGITKQKALETVLNLIDKRNIEIEHQKEKRENQKNELAILNEKQKEFNKMLNTIKSYKGQFKRQEKEIDKLNKVIDEMIEEYEFSARINVKDFCEECQRKDKCIQDCHTHIKQYFIGKAEKGV